MTGISLAPDSLGPTVSIGEILVEIVAMTVGNGFVESQPFVGPYPSGAPAIFIDQCARMGGSSAMIGAVGDDDFGMVNLNRLKDDGVDIGAIKIDPDYPTGSAFVRYRQDGSRDFVFNISQSAAARFGWTDSVEDLISRAGHLHVMGTALSMPSAVEVIDRALSVIKRRGGSLSFDPNIRKELKLDGATEQRFADLVTAADLLLPSGDELYRAADVSTEESAVQALFARGVKEIVLKRGASGASCFRPKFERLDATAFNVEVIDPTGAGDCFGGAYVACRRLGMSAAQALDYACAAGARNVTYRGPMQGAGTRADLDEFIATELRYK
jgi:sugar/nucleoside kinase (ribokinase family)